MVNDFVSTDSVLLELPYANETPDHPVCDASTEKANAYILSHKDSVVSQYRQEYHASAPIGWINDPNGLCFFQGRYHLYCQYNPYDAHWGLMHWGHWVSDDLISWEWKGVALAPDSTADKGGCYSGTAIPVGDSLYLMYTGISQAMGKEIQQQCLAYSTDGTSFRKEKGNPVIPGSLLPDGFSTSDFRDPKVYKADDGYRALVAGQENGRGRFLLYSSPDLKNWHFESVLFDGNTRMIECPDIFQLNGQTALMCGVIGRADGVEHCPHRRPVIMYLGALSEDGRHFEQSASLAVDYGTDFYGPQTILSPDGRRIMIGWMQNWDRLMPTAYLFHGWNGCMSLPRELCIEDGTLYQRPVREIEAYRRSEHKYQIESIIGQGIEISAASEVLMDIRGVDHELTVNLFENGEEALIITIDPQRGIMQTDSSHSGLNILMKSDTERQIINTPIRVHEGNLQLRIFLDTCSAELFVNQGEQVVSTRVFPRAPGLQQISIISTDLRCSGSMTVYRLGKE